MDKLRASFVDYFGSKTLTNSIIPRAYYDIFGDDVLIHSIERAALMAVNGRLLIPYFTKRPRSFGLVMDADPSMKMMITVISPQYAQILKTVEIISNEGSRSFVGLKNSTVIISKMLIKWNFPEEITVRLVYFFLEETCFEKMPCEEEEEHDDWF